MEKWSARSVICKSASNRQKTVKVLDFMTVLTIFIMIIFTIIRMTNCKISHNCMKEYCVFFTWFSELKNQEWVSFS